MTIPEFQELVWQYYSDHGRTLPWRTNTAPYRVWVSEIMLQQTQVNRVITKYEQFMATFPDVESVATAPFSNVLTVWSGLGYNRRAQYLHRTAQIVVGKYKGAFPNTIEELQQLPGIGVNTAAAIVAYAYNKPVTFIETNIRSVYIHHFFQDQTNVKDKSILALVEASVIRDNPREWYWALMDYGTFLKSQHPNPSRKSAHHKTQSAFEGSDRQIRGKIVSKLLKGPLKLADLHDYIADERSTIILKKLHDEKLVVIKNGCVSL